MGKVTLASQNAIIEKLQANIAKEESNAQTERVKRIAAERELNDALKAFDGMRHERDEARMQVERYRGMIEMLERLDKIPKQEAEIKFDGFGNRLF